MKVKLNNGWGGTEFTTDSGRQIKISVNFRAVCCETRRQVIVISRKEYIRDMGASWDVDVFDVYDEENLTMLSNTVNGEINGRPRYIEFKEQQ